MNRLIFVLIIAATCWIFSEALEIVSGGLNVLTRWTTSGVYLLMAMGVWGSRPTIASTQRFIVPLLLLLTAGYLLLLYPILDAGVLTWPEADSLHMISKGLLGLGSLCLLFGGIGFGSAIIRKKLFPVWTGQVLIGTALLTFIIFLTGQPFVVANISNSLQAAAWIAIGIERLKNMDEPVLI